MTEYTSIYGIIKLNGHYEESVAFLKGLGKDTTYPAINSNMFSYGDYEIPYYYEDMVLGFAATYKYFGLDLSDWNDFITKIEDILHIIDFENAQFHIESSIGDFTLFWSSQKAFIHKNEEELLKEEKLIKNDHLYFGFGKRSVLSGVLDKDLLPHEDLRNSNIGFVYPIPKK